MLSLTLLLRLWFITADRGMRIYHFADKKRRTSKEPPTRRPGYGRSFRFCYSSSFTYYLLERIHNGFGSLWVFQRQVLNKIFSTRWTMAVWIARGRWVVVNVAVEIEALRIPEARVGDVGWLGGPVGRHEAPEAAAVVSGPEHIQAGFGVSFFAGELVAGLRRYAK